jgi:hypothetical protein
MVHLSQKGRFKMKKCFVLIAVMLAMTGQAWASAQTDTTEIYPPCVINQAGIYKLMAGATFYINATKPGISIAASNVTVLGNGSAILGEPGQEGVVGIEIKPKVGNVEISGFHLSGSLEYAVYAKNYAGQLKINRSRLSSIHYALWLEREENTRSNDELVENSYSGIIWISGNGVVLKNSTGFAGDPIVLRGRNLVLKDNYGREGGRMGIIHGPYDDHAVAIYGDSNVVENNHIVGDNTIRGIHLEGNHNVVAKDTIEECLLGIVSLGARNKITDNTISDCSAGIVTWQSITSEYSRNSGENRDNGLILWADDGNDNTVITNNYGCGNTVSGISCANQEGYDSTGSSFHLPGNHVNEWADSLGTLCGSTITEEEFNFLPKDFSLAQNYPNPFNGSTSISYSLPRLAQIKLVVYDLLGREVAVLINKWQLPGTYQLIWNAGHLPSGIYFAVITTESEVRKIKMTLVR